MRGIRYKRFYVSSLLLVLITIATVGSLSARSIPVFRKTKSGNLELTGWKRELPEEFPGRRTDFSFDMTSGRGFNDDGRPLFGSSSKVSGTWHVAFIRIGFNSDRDDNLSSISTGGDFLLEPDDSYIIDPPPHNKAYFDAHMRALRNYYDLQSCGKVDITWEIFPEEEDASYKLTDVADFGPGAYGSWTTQMLVDFVRASVEEADGDVDFSSFDAVVIAHAGASLQSDVDIDSPNDIPSFFVSLGEDDQFELDGGLTTFRECSVIPESDVQDGYYGGIAAVLAHEFGHQLGLPDLYNTLTSYTGIGIWGNMGSGGQMSAYIDDEEGNIYIVSGIIPSGLCAWSRYYLGWVRPDTVQTFDNMISLRAVENCPAEVVRVDISNEEYFLIENRCVEIDGYANGGFVDEETGVILGIKNCLNCPHDTNVVDILEEDFTNGYDMLLPIEGDFNSTDAGPGLLIWHIDERLIAERWLEDIVNSIEPFGVRLMEANGFFDIGDPTSGFGLGWYDDAYHAGYNDLLSDSTHPPAWSNMNVPSGVRIERISEMDTLMTFGAGVRALAAGRQLLCESIAEGTDLLPLGTGYSVLALDESGRGWLSGQSSHSFALEDAPVGPPALAGDFSPAGDAVIIGGTSGSVHALTTGAWNEVEGNWPVQLEGLSSHPIVIERDGIHVAAPDTAGTVSIYDNYGVEEMSFTMSSGYVNGANITADRDSDGETNFIMFLGSSDIPGYDPVLWWWDIGLNEAVSIEFPVSGDLRNERVALASGYALDDGGYPEVYVTLMDRGEVILCSINGVVFRNRVNGAITNVPALADINGDTAIDIVFSDGEAVYAMGPSGSYLTGWPRYLKEIYETTEEEHIDSPVSVASDGNGSMVFALSGNGILYAFAPDGEFAGSSYPVRIASRADLPMVLEEIYGENLISYIDPLENGEGAYYANRPERLSVEWRRIPFESGDMIASWSGLWGDPARTAGAVPTARWSSPAQSWSNLENNLVIYPNPSDGRRVGFHFMAPSGSKATLQIVDIRGEIVIEDGNTFTGGEEHEFVISMGDEASGIYIARVVVSYQGETVETAKKFAIVK